MENEKGMGTRTQQLAAAPGVYKRFIEGGDMLPGPKLDKN